MPTLRLFIAADLDAAQQAAAADLIARLQKGIHFTQAHPKWVGPEGMHLTLNFLGAVDSSRVESIVRAVAPAVARTPAFQFDLRSLGVFPDPRQPKVLWVGVHEGRKALCELQSRTAQTLKPLGFPPETRAFHPHLTLARIKSQRGVEAMMDVVHSHRDAALGAAALDHLTLYQSDLSPAGARYTALHRWPLADPSVTTQSS